MCVSTGNPHCYPHVYRSYWSKKSLYWLLSETSPFNPHSYAQFVDIKNSPLVAIDREFLKSHHQTV